MTDQHFIRRAHVPEGHKVTIPGTTVRYIDGEYVSAPFDPDDPTAQVPRAKPQEASA